MSITAWFPPQRIFPWQFDGALPEPVRRPEETPGPQLLPERPARKPPRFPLWAVGLMLALGAAVGAALWSAVESGAETAQVAAGPVETIRVEKTRFTRTVRIGGTVGAKNFAMIRAPRMRGGRDRGPGAGGGGGLVIAALAEPGSMVEKGDVVAEFESKRTEDILDDYESTLAQTRSRVGTRKGEILIATETLRQEYRTAKGDAGKAGLDVRTAEVRSDIEAEILRLLAEEGQITVKQLDEQVRLQEIADQAELRSLDLGVAQDEKRLERTKFDLERMKLRSPVAGLVVIETVFQRGSFSQASPGDEVRAGSYFMRVVDLSKMAVFANLNQVDSQMVQMGSPVKVQLDAYPEVQFEGRVASVGAMAKSGGSSGGVRGPPGSSGSRDQWVKQVAIEIEILEQDERVSPDLSASADILVEEQDTALVIPRAAIESRGDSRVVWVRDGEGFAAREVQLGSISDTQAIVVSGLSEGQEIAAQPPTEAETRLAQR